eukprot:scaffold71007_cov71-Phaeocystis_antarctica.AAC.8
MLLREPVSCRWRQTSARAALSQRTAQGTCTWRDAPAGGQRRRAEVSSLQDRQQPLRARVRRVGERDVAIDQ